MFRLIAVVGALLALLVPAAALAGADVSTNRYCEYGYGPDNVAGIGTLVLRDNGFTAVCRLVDGRVIVYTYRV